jgi:hypothetical protein
MRMFLWLLDVLQVAQSFELSFVMIVFSRVYRWPRGQAPVYVAGSFRRLSAFVAAHAMQTR